MITSDDTPLPSLTPTILEGAAHFQDSLIEAVQAEDLNGVRMILTTIPSRLQRAALLYPSVKMEHKLQTPLMASAATGNISIVGAILASFEALFVGDGDKKESERRRQKEMKRQMEIDDVDDRTLLMHASSSGSSAMFNVISQEVQRQQFRKVLTQQDANGMTFLHHAINGKSDENTDDIPEEGQSPSPSAAQPPDGWSDDPMLVVDNPGGEETPAPVSDADLLDPWVPVVKSAFKFARASLWLPEYRRQLTVRDAWGRSAVEHALNCGRPQVLEVVFEAIRRDVYDEEMDRLLDPGISTNHGESSMAAALKSGGGKKLTRLIAEKAKSLKSDVSHRSQDSTVASKIQSFVPGNLIVIFQLLLPESGEDGTGPLSLLAVLCFIAPLWSWGASMGMGKGDPKLRNTRARVTAAKYALAGPAMFFWGISTSTIGEVSFNMSETVSAAALAVATIIIPALDSFFSGGGARQTFSKVFIMFLDFWDKLTKKTSSKIARARQLDGDDDSDKRGSRRSNALATQFGGSPTLDFSGTAFQRNSLDGGLSSLRSAMEERTTSAREAMRALTELSPSEQTARLHKAFGEGKTAAALGLMDPRSAIEDGKTETVEALRSLDVREAIEEGVASVREHVESLAGEGEAKLREVVEEGKDRAVEAAEGLAAPLTAPTTDPGRSK